MSDADSLRRQLEAVFEASQLVTQATKRLQQDLGASAVLSIEAERLQIMLHNEERRTRLRFERLQKELAALRASDRS